MGGPDPALPGGGRVCIRPAGRMLTRIALRAILVRALVEIFGRFSKALANFRLSHGFSVAFMPEGMIFHAKNFNWVILRRPLRLRFVYLCGQAGELGKEHSKIFRMKAHRLIVAIQRVHIVDGRAPPLEQGFDGIEQRA